MIQPYLRRRMGMEEPVYIHPDLRPALSETHGVIVYHEQVIRALAAIAGYDLTYADHIRRHLDRRGDAAGVPRRLPGEGDGARRRPAAAEKAWAAVAEFASFGFCKAHAAAFAVPTYQSAWLKAHYPAHFLAGILTHDPGMYPRRLLLEDARQHDIPILPLDANVQRARVRGRGDRRRACSASDWRCRTCTASATPRSARSCRGAPIGRSATWGTSCAGRPSPGR